MKVLFYCHEFRRDNLRLMPWRYIYEIALGLIQRSYDVKILSVGNLNNSIEENISGIKVFHEKLKDVFISEMSKRLFNESDLIIWSSSAMTVLLYKKLKNLKIPLILLFTGPFYSVSEILRAQLCSVPFRQLVVHYKYSILSLRLTAALINSNLIRTAVILSEKNAKILKMKGCNNNKLSVIPPGHDRSGVMAIEGVSVKQIRGELDLPSKKKIIIYLGSLYQIRGVNVLLEAFLDICKISDNILLLILARTDNKNETEALIKRVNVLGIEKNTIIISGILEKNIVQNYLIASDVAVLPFILVPSDMPLGALEAMALGKPVITTEIDGMPEMVSGRGKIVKPGNKRKLSDAALSIFNDYNLYNSMRNNCISYMSKYPTWQETSEKLSSLIQKHANT